MLPRVIRLRGRASMVAGALIILAGVGVPATILTQSDAQAAVPPTALGTDISNMTTVNNWPGVKFAGNTFVGIEAAQGAGITNSNYSQEATDAASAGLFVMPYIFADPAKETTGNAQFSKGWSIISTAPYASGGQDLPVALDLEWDHINFANEECYGLTQSAMVTWIQQFVTAAEQQTGLTPIIYTDQEWWNDCTGNSTAFAADPLWVPAYDTPAPALPAGGWPAYTFWQTSNTAAINGIDGPGDLDLFQSVPSTLTATVGTSGSKQIQTLNSLAGQSVTYTASGLSTGLSLSSGGDFSWTGLTPVGAHPITVTASVPSGAVVPSPISFTLDVHGAITVAGTNRSTNAGSPVLYQVSGTGPDQSGGVATSYTASGLPPGLSISSSGVISGWPYQPGTYTVTVHASDALGGTGSASFTWTVNAAAATGTSGYIKQNGGTSKCLSAPASATKITANEVYLWSCGGESWQDWTVVQDGTIRVGGKCLQMAGTGSATSTALELETCSSGNSEQQWRAATDGQLVNPAADKCLSIQSSSAANGAKPVVHACASSADYHFLRPASPVTSGEPAKCLAVSGSAIEIVTCADSTSQHWVSESNGTFEVSSDGDCLKEGGTTAGSKAILGGCSSTTVDEWSLPSSGRIGVELKNDASGLCVSVPSSSTASGTQLVMEPCAATPTESWHVE